ncbi:MAG: hypothetical protein GY780_18850 [bacterium]|nr:hypothetical protein [bacterium]
MRMVQNTKSFKTLLIMFLLVIPILVVGCNGDKQKTDSGPIGASNTPPQAASINVYGTGLNDAHGLLADGEADTHYKIKGTGANAIAIDPLGTYAPNGPNSRWIWDRQESILDVSSNSGKSLTFVTTFDLAGFNHTTTVLTGKWAADNNGSIWLNGIKTSVADLVGSALGNFSSLHSFVINSGFVAGLNTLEFRIENTELFGGLRVDIAGTAEQEGDH